MKLSIVIMMGIGILICSPEVTLASSIHNSSAVESRVRAVFHDSPAMIEIARCESKFRQFTDSGNPLRGPGGMIGVFQFNEAVHSEAARSLGHNLATLEGNLAYARHIFETEGTAPWNSARFCWEMPAKEAAAKATTTASTTPSRAELERKITQLRQLISLLQQLLALRST